MTTLVFLSDSNGTETYASGANNMAQILATRFVATKVNSSVSGNTVNDMRARVASDVLAHSPDYLFIMAGTNDAAFANDNYVPASVWIEQYLSDMEDLINDVLGNGIDHIVVASPPVPRVTRLVLEWPAACEELKALCAIKGVKYSPVYENLMTLGAAYLGYTTAPTPTHNASPDQYHLNNYGHSIAAIVMGDSLAESIYAPPAGCVWNSSILNTNCQFSNGNLSVKQAVGTTGCTAWATESHSSGKWYFEVTYTTPVSLTTALTGVSRAIPHVEAGLASTGLGSYWYDSGGRCNTGVSPAELTSQTTWDGSGNTIGILVDLDNGDIDFIDKNGATINAFSGITLGPEYWPIAGLMSGVHNSNLITANFTGSFVHTPPGGYSAWG